MEEVRVDQWLWGVRLFKTRTLATNACRARRVSVNGIVAKAATPVRVGDRVELKLGGRDRVFEVAQAIDKRVGPAVAATCLVDHSPPPPPKDESGPTFERERGAGRPTKRDRRRLDRIQGPPSSSSPN